MLSKLCRELRLARTVMLPVVFLTVAFVALSYHRSEPSHELSAESARRLTAESQSLIAEKQYFEALKPTLRLYEAYPEDHIYIERLARIYGHLGKFDEESKYWELYVDRAPMPIEACPFIAQAYWKQGEQFKAQAITAYRHCLAFDPNNTDSLFYLGHALEMSGQWSEAAENYQRGLGLAPQYVDLTLGLARCKLRMDKPETAMELIEPILNRKSQVNSGALLVLGMYYLDQKQYPLAKKVLTRGSQISEGDSDFHMLLARVAEEENLYGEAALEYAKVVEMTPEDSQARSKLLALQSLQKVGNQ